MFSPSIPLHFVLYKIVNVHQIGRTGGRFRLSNSTRINQSVHTSGAAIQLMLTFDQPAYTGVRAT